MPYRKSICRETDSSTFYIRWHLCSGKTSSNSKQISGSVLSSRDITNLCKRKLEGAGTCEACKIYFVFYADESFNPLAWRYNVPDELQTHHDYIHLVKRRDIELRPLIPFWWINLSSKIGLWRIKHGKKFHSSKSEI